jgi:sulfate adenylyltransferase
MGKDDFEFVVYEESLNNGLPWTIPVILTSDSKSVEDLKEGDAPVLIYNGKPLAILHLDEKFSFDKNEYAKNVFKTTDLTHPDVTKLNATGDIALAGKISLIERFTSPGELTPQETRNEFEKRGWETITAFQTRNPPHVAHEYIQRCALELVDGLLIYPVV